ncbi:M48 family metalloprotease [Paracoccus sp. M683]|uniref:M48 family metalloprotease n=1 Tax=Paracoccus sp. M683 TaxID=2594268 RepID=UPI0011809EA1|nr:M48 family metalloprotease [Paracoccus sp. M683]TRW97699.1 M48 family metalloprotease [Paracoccus sp. M683]
MRIEKLTCALLGAALGVASCAPLPDAGVTTVPAGDAGKPVVAAPSPDRGASATEAARSFVAVMRKMEPAVERECLQRRTQPINCDFQFVVDDRAGLEPNAFQTVDATGRPIIGFTLSLIAAARNADELAFVVGHEASHHILGHLDQKSRAATAGAVLGSILGAYTGDGAVIRTAQQIGASISTRSFSKEWELQSDYLGAIITLNAGYDPRNGARFFERIPDPGDRILGSHPSRAARIAQVERAVDDYTSGRVR